MLPCFHRSFANPSSLHSPGREARDAVDTARRTLAATLGADPDEIVFTSGGTESNNTAIKAMAFANFARGRHVITTAIEHDSVLNSANWLATIGFEVTLLDVDADGLVDPGQLERAIRPDSILVSVIHANNEIGTIQPITELARICHERGVPFHTDACQSFTYVTLNVRDIPADLITINGHKIHGPKGVGALYIRRGTHIVPWQHGGGHEQGLRASTENVPGIVGFAEAARLALAEQSTTVPRLLKQRDRIIEFALRNIPGAYLNGHRTSRLPNNVNLGFDGLEGDAIHLLLELDKAGICVSSGSACSSHNAESKPSHVLTAIGRNPIQARGALRVTLGRDSTDAEVRQFLDTLPDVIKRLRPIMSFSN
jgi:cysteine desulfurase